MKSVLIVESDMDYAIEAGIRWGRKGFAPIFAFSIREAVAETRLQEPELILVTQSLRDSSRNEFLKELHNSGYYVQTGIRVKEDGLDNKYILIDKSERIVIEESIDTE